MQEQMNMPNLDDQIRRGIEAQRFLQFIGEGEQYFKKIIEEIDDELMKEDRKSVV